MGTLLESDAPCFFFMLRCLASGERACEVWFCTCGYCGHYYTVATEGFFVLQTIEVRVLNLVIWGVGLGLQCSPDDCSSCPNLVVLGLGARTEDPGKLAWTLSRLPGGCSA